jgi:hypothetical protein
MIFSQQAVLSLAHASLCFTFIFGFLGLYKGRLARVMAEVSTLSGVCATVIYSGGAAATHGVPREEGQPRGPLKDIEKI